MLYTVNHLAERYAARVIPDKKDATEIDKEEIEIRRRPTIYNFNVTGFNISTVARIATSVVAVAAFALHFFATAAVFGVIAFLASQVRRSFMMEVYTTGQNARDAGPIKALGVVPEDFKESVIGHLDITDAKWEPVKHQLLDFRIWMNKVPAKALAILVEGRPAANRERAYASSHV